jgi:hypothetical protein
MIDLVDFITESNLIEGINRPPSQIEIEATTRLLLLPALKVEDIETFVSTIQPGAILRSRPGLNVRVGNHIPPPGGQKLKTELVRLLNAITTGKVDPWIGHVVYETLHPFTDGNGRSGRAIWLWHMKHHCGGTELTFLHSFYYQSLACYDSAYADKQAGRNRQATTPLRNRRQPR